MPASFSMRPISSASLANAFDTLLLGSGDREHPFETTSRTAIT